MKNRKYPIVIGVSPKGMLAGKGHGHMRIAICRLKGNRYSPGEQITDLHYVTSIEQEMWFCRKESLRAFIDCLQTVYDNWDD